jgi:hypothetical protein
MSWEATSPRDSCVVGDWLLRGKIKTNAERAPTNINRAQARIEWLIGSFKRFSGDVLIAATGLLL